MFNNCYSINWIAPNFFSYFVVQSIERLLFNQLNNTDLFLCLLLFNRLNGCCSINWKTQILFACLSIQSIGRFLLNQLNITDFFYVLLFNRLDKLIFCMFFYSFDWKIIVQLIEQHINFFCIFVVQSIGQLLFNQLNNINFLYVLLFNQLNNTDFFLYILLRNRLNNCYSIN